MSDLQDREPALISKCGTLEVIFNYSAMKAKMTVKIGVARDIPTKERGGASNVQVSKSRPREVLNKQVENKICQSNCFPVLDF